MSRLLPRMASASESEYSERQVQLISVCTACMALSTAAVGLRLLVRRFGSVANSWWDDWITVLALVCFRAKEPFDDIIN